MHQRKSNIELLRKIWYLSIHLSIDLSISLSIYLSIYPSMYLSIYLSMYLSFCLSIYLIAMKKTAYLKNIFDLRLCQFISFIFYLKLLHKIFFIIFTVGLRQKVKILWENICMNDSSLVILAYTRRLNRSG